MIFGYYINLDERGQFFADVRDANDNTIYEIHGDDPYLFEMRNMRDKEDVFGLTEYLRTIGVIAVDDEVLSMQNFERAPV